MLARAGRAVERGALTKSARPTFPEAEPTVLPCTAGNTRMDPQGQRFHGAFSSALQEKKPGPRLPSPALSFSVGASPPGMPPTALAGPGYCLSSPAEK